MARRVLKKKKKRKQRAVNPAVVVIFAACIIVYAGIAAFFSVHFFPGTVIGDVNCGGKTPQRVKELIAAQASEYKLTITGKSSEKEVIQAEDINLQYLVDDTISDVKKTQNAALWLFDMWKDANHPIGMETSYDEESLEKCLKRMSFFEGYASTGDFSVTTQNGEEIYRLDAVVNAKSENSSSDVYQMNEDQSSGKKFSTIFSHDEPDEERHKNFDYPDIDLAKAAVKTAIENLDVSLDLVEAGCYGDVALDTTDAQNSKAALTPNEELIEKYTSARITYDWHGMEEVVDEKLIKDWIVTDQGHADISWDKVNEYITGISRKYDRFGSPRTFHTTKGEDIRIEVVCYGWRVKRDAETDALIDDIKNGRIVSREPEYLYTAYVKGESDIGDSYVEIDLNSQHLWLYFEGKMVLESDFVSGNVSKSFNTPDGIYPITYKERDATLNGQGYSSPVKYWMPFNGNVGMHDASWRNEFGGDIFLRNGSHGCVNLPVASARQIFEYVEKGFPVIVYGGKEGAARLPKSAPPKTEEPAVNEAVPDVDPEILLQMQQMLLLQQQQLQELEKQGIDTAATEPAAGVESTAGEPETGE